MVSSEMLRRVALVRTDISEKLSASFIKVTRICELGTTLVNVRRLLITASVVPSSPILVTLMKEALSSSEASVLRRTTRRNIPEETLRRCHRRENLKSYTACMYFPILIYQTEYLFAMKLCIYFRFLLCFALILPSAVQP
jgi:hypothetical protein